MSAPDAPAQSKFSKKDLLVDWDKVRRVAPLVDQVLGARSEEPAVVANARRLEKFYPHLVRWDVMRSKPVRSPRCVCVCVCMYVHSPRRAARRAGLRTAYARVLSFVRAHHRIHSKP